MNIDLHKLLEKFSLITVGENKVPNFSWKQQQTQKLTWEKFTEQYNYKGGKFKQDNTEIPATTNVGIVTGFEYLECIDVDLKVFSTAQEKKDFWNEFVTYLEDNILDFWDKFVVYKTKNDGYHILYKSKRCDKNQKLAKLKGHKEAVIETRGAYGYVFLYPENNVGKKTYFDIDFVSDDDREIVFSFAKMYDYIEQKDYKQDKPKLKQYETGSLTPWQDYNEKTDILTLISDDFEIKHRMETAKKYVIKRIGAQSVHSGYIFKDTGCMYLFSTGTIYPSETLLTPFHVYCYKYHSGDFSSAAKALYNDGFGDRTKVVIPEPLKKEIKPESVSFPLHIFPSELQLYIQQSDEKLMLNSEIMACSFLWLSSVIIGNSCKIRIKNGWTESPILFIALVGLAGLGKTHSTNQIINPLKKINQKKVEDYFFQFERYQEYLEAVKKSKNNTVVPVDKPRRKQIIAIDTTIEALINLHSESKNAIGINKDELDGWFKDMNKYREGSDKQQWLSIWSNEPIVVNRLTRSDLYIASPFISLIGGIQPEILDSHFTHENVSSGFIDRFLFCYPENLKAPDFNENELDASILEHYNNTIITMYRSVQDSLKYSDNNDIIPKIITLSQEAYNCYVEIFNNISKQQNDESEAEMFKPMLAKIKTYIPRLALILHFIKCFYENKPHANTSVSDVTMYHAWELAQYFISQFKRIKIDSIENRQLFEMKIGKKQINTSDNFKELYKQLNKENINKTQLAKQFGVSRATINNWIKLLENDNT